MGQPDNQPPASPVRQQPHVSDCYNRNARNYMGRRGGAAAEVRRYTLPQGEPHRVRGRPVYKRTGSPVRERPHATNGYSKRPGHPATKVRRVIAPRGGPRRSSGQPDNKHCKADKTQRPDETARLAYTGSSETQARLRCREDTADQTNAAGGDRQSRTHCSLDKNESRLRSKIIVVPNSVPNAFDHPLSVSPKNSQVGMSYQQCLRAKPKHAGRQESSPRLTNKAFRRTRSWMNARRQLNHSEYTSRLGEDLLNADTAQLASAEHKTQSLAEEASSAEPEPVSVPIGTDREEGAVHIVSQTESLHTVETDCARRDCAPESMADPEAVGVPIGTDREEGAVHIVSQTESLHTVETDCARRDCAPESMADPEAVGVPIGTDREEGAVHIVSQTESLHTVETDCARRDCAPESMADPEAVGVPIGTDREEGAVHIVSQNTLEDMLRDVEYVNAFQEHTTCDFYSSDLDVDKQIWNVESYQDHFVDPVSQAVSSILPSSSDNSDRVLRSTERTIQGNADFENVCDYIFQQNQSVQPLEGQPHPPEMPEVPRHTQPHEDQVDSQGPVNTLFELVQKLISCSVCNNTFNRTFVCEDYLIQLNRPIQCACCCVLCSLCYREQKGCRTHKIVSARAVVNATASILASCPDMEKVGEWDLELDDMDHFKTEADINRHVQQLMTGERTPGIEALRSAFNSLMTANDSMSFKHWLNEALPEELAYRYVCIPHIKWFWNHIAAGKWIPGSTEVVYSTIRVTAKQAAESGTGLQTFRRFQFGPRRSFVGLKDRDAGSCSRALTDSAQG
ncbi:hypothetical protein DPEC_G00067610 [Dallia pectoralis]|uniref:Uncharacterized protein n=1 Tax=Dallia pectoralis TaxID=75939 RepID=A0ACC2H169_DALPE|nr:hypothetical protein DPEC_G00067610 [Dallia pectoralis]